MLDGTEGSLKESLQELVWFAKLSGLTYNYSKTQVIWIGTKRYSEVIICANMNLSCGETSTFNHCF